MKDIVMKIFIRSPRSAGRTVDDLSGKDKQPGLYLDCR